MHLLTIGKYLPDQHEGDLKVSKIPHRTPCMSTTLDIPAEIQQPIKNNTYNGALSRK